MTASGAQKIKGLSIPDHNGPDRHIRLLCKALENHGVDIVGLTSSTALSLKIDVIQLHFPAHYVVERSLLYSLVRSTFMLLFFPLAKYVGGCKIVYMVHDPIPFRPRRGWLLWPMLNFVHRIVDGFIFLSDVSRDDFLRRFPDHGHKPFARIDHSALPVPIEVVIALAPSGNPRVVAQRGVGRRLSRDDQGLQRAGLPPSHTRHARRRDRGPCDRRGQGRPDIRVARGSDPGGARATFRADRSPPVRC